MVALSRAEADIADPAAVRAAISRHKPSLVVNAAAYTKVDAAESETEAARLGNEIGPAVLAAACAAAGVPLIHISTDYVFDGSKDGAYLEDDPIAPINAYGRTKAAGERAVRETRVRHVILRTSWVYGEFGQNFLKTMLKLAATRDELRVVSDQRGCPTSTADLAAAILAIAPRLAASDDVWGTYHYAGSRRDDMAWFCEPHRRRAGAAHRTRTTRDRHSRPGTFRQRRAGLPIPFSTAASSRACSALAVVLGPKRPIASRARWSALKERHVA